jgi:hypothetical protein
LQVFREWWTASTISLFWHFNLFIYLRRLININFINNR